MNGHLVTMGHFSTNSIRIERLKMFHLYFTISYAMVTLVIPFLLFLACTILVMASLFQPVEQKSATALATTAPAWKRTPPP